MTVNGKEASLGDRADIVLDLVAIDGRLLPPPLEHVYIALNKPAGYACTRHDPHMPETVYDLLPTELHALFTVGRLDIDTTGLLLMTNDGDWANAIAHPREHVEKTYVADVEGDVTEEKLEALRWGVPLPQGVTYPALVRQTWSRPADWLSRLQITIAEGRNRQIRRMLDYIDVRVLSLTRISVGSLTIGDLPEGRWRHLEVREVEALKRDAGQ